MVRADDKTSAAVERTMLILEAIAGRTSGLTNSEICRRVSIPKSTASYILRTLELTRYVTRDRLTGKYRLGLKLLVLGRGVHIGREVKKSAAPILRSVVHKTGLTGHIAVLDHGEAVYIEKIDA